MDVLTQARDARIVCAHANRRRLLQRNNELLFFRIEVVAASDFALSTFCHACLLALLVILAVAGEVLWPATRKAIRVQGLGFQYVTCLGSL